MLHMSCRPSQLIDIKDSYTAFCFDEVCAFIMTKIQNKEELKKNLGEEAKPKKYTKASDLYNNIMNK